MRRRIERSRARCEKTSDTYKPEKPQTQEPRPQADDDESATAQTSRDCAR
jgi:hypothetical protein